MYMRLQIYIMLFWPKIKNMETKNKWDTQKTNSQNAKFKFTRPHQM